MAKKQTGFVRLSDILDPKQRSEKGRPRSATSLASATVNYQALAWQVKQRIDTETQAGRKLKIKDAVRAEMLASVKWNNERRSEGKTLIRNGLVAEGKKLVSEALSKP
jgi:hypothetical protein